MAPSRAATLDIEDEIYSFLVDEKLLLKEASSGLSESFTSISDLTASNCFSYFNESSTLNHWSEHDEDLQKSTEVFLSSSSVSALPAILEANSSSPQTASGEATISAPIKNGKKAVRFGTTKVYQHGLVIGDQEIDCPLQLDWNASRVVCVSPVSRYGNGSTSSSSSSSSSLSPTNGKPGRRRRRATAARLSPQQRREWLASVSDLNLQRWEPQQQKRSSFPPRSCSSASSSSHTGRWSTGADSDSPPSFCRVSNEARTSPKAIPFLTSLLDEECTISSRRH